MKIFLAKDAGYCFGVRDAVNLAYDVAQKEGNVYMLGDIVHNEKVVNDLNKASEIDKLLQPLHTSLFIESNPSPIKYAASLLGMCKPNVRLPLVEIKEETKKKVSDALKVAKLL